MTERDNPKSNEENPHLVALTPQQARFVQIYARKLNATKAYEQSEYKAKGRSATAAATRLLSNVIVRRALDAEIALITKELAISKDWLIARLASEGAGKHIAGEKKGEPIPTRQPRHA